MRGGYLNHSGHGGGGGSGGGGSGGAVAGPAVVSGYHYSSKLRPAAGVGVGGGGGGAASSSSIVSVPRISIYQRTNPLAPPAVQYAADGSFHLADSHVLHPATLASFGQASLPSHASASYAHFASHPITFATSPGNNAAAATTATSPTAMAGQRNNSGSNQPPPSSSLPPLSHPPQQQQQQPQQRPWTSQAFGQAAQTARVQQHDRAVQTSRPSSPFDDPSSSSSSSSATSAAINPQLQLPAAAASLLVQHLPPSQQQQQQQQQQAQLSQQQQQQQQPLLPPPVPMQLQLSMQTPPLPPTTTGAHHATVPQATQRPGYEWTHLQLLKLHEQAWGFEDGVGEDGAEEGANGERMVQVADGTLLPASASLFPGPTFFEDSISAFAASVVNWDEFDIFDLYDATNGWPLSFLFMIIDRRHGFLGANGIDPVTAFHFIQEVESNYLPNPYHTATHAADVLHAAFHLVEHTPLLRAGLSQLDCFVLYISCAVHDFQHPGVVRIRAQNTQEVEEKLAESLSTHILLFCCALLFLLLFL